MPNTALVTGASSGIGAEFARYHASLGGDLILVARREEQLNALKAELEGAHGINVSVIAKDIGSAEKAKSVYEGIAKTGAKIDILINNAGFGGHGKFIERTLDQDLAMIDLNIDALVTLCHLVGNDMAKSGSGKILNVGSTAGFLPGPNQATYFATKAFVNSFSQALNPELRPKGVTCTVLAPGYVETEFARAANLEGTAMVKGGGKTAASAAKIGYDAMLKGTLVKINELKLGFLLNWVIPLLPRRLVLKISEDMQSK